MSETQSGEDLTQRFDSSGQRQKILQIMHESLANSGWVGEVEEMCREYVEQNKNRAEKVTVRELTEAIRARARHHVPDEVKRELLDMIREYFQKETGFADL